VHHADPQTRQKADLSGIKRRPFGKQKCSLWTIGAARSDVLKGFGRGAKGGMGVFCGDIFLDHNDIGPFGDRCARKDARTRATLEGSRGLGGCDVLEDRKCDGRGLGGIRDICAVKGITIHR
jgi:hypothetical protein